MSQENFPANAEIKGRTVKKARSFFERWFWIKKTSKKIIIKAISARPVPDDLTRGRENNGKQWIKELTGKDVPVVLDPTLLLDVTDYDKIEEKIDLPKKYIFYYSPSYNKKINKLVSRISKKYNLPVIAFNKKNFVTKGMMFSGFKLPKIENPSVYLYLIKNATLVITTSFHGTIFSTIYKKRFWTIKNGGMFGDDDRVRTLMDNLDLNDRLITMNFDKDFDYLQDKDYANYEKLLYKMQQKSMKYLDEALK